MPADNIIFLESTNITTETTTYGKWSSGDMYEELLAYVEITDQGAWTDETLDITVQVRDHDGGAYDIAEFDQITDQTVAITAQIANNSGKGDIIWVAPGTYAESLTGTLSKVQIIGTNCGGTTHAVSIRPTTSYSYTGSMTDSAFRNIMFMSPSASSKTLPAVLLTYMGYSVIDSCTFIGRDATCVEGLQLGATADGTTVIKCDFSQITNNQFTSFYGASSEFSHGIKLGTTTGTNGASRQMWHSLIANNVIHASTIGIWLGCGANKAAGTVIRNNWIGSDNAGGGCTSYGIGALATGDAAVFRLIVADNYIMAADGLYQIDDGCSFNNFISASGAAVVTELPVRT